MLSPATIFSALTRRLFSCPTLAFALVSTILVFSYFGTANLRLGLHNLGFSLLVGLPLQRRVRNATVRHGGGDLEMGDWFLEWGEEDAEGEESLVLSEGFGRDDRVGLWNRFWEGGVRGV